MIKKNINYTYIIEYLWIVLGLFVIVYNPPILRINAMHVVGIVSWIYLLSICKMDRENIKNIFIWCIFFCYLVLVAYVINRGNMSEIIFPLYYIIDIIPFGCVVGNVIIKNGDDLDTFWKLIVYMALVQAVLSMVSFLYSNLQMYFFDRYISYGYGDRETLLELTGYRMFGFASELTFSMPLVQSLVAIGCLIKSQLPTPLRTCVVTIILLSALLNARTSIVVSGIGIFIILIRSDFKTKMKYILLTILAGALFLTVGMTLLEHYAYGTFFWMEEAISDLSLMIRGDKSGYYFSYLFDPKNHPMPRGVFHSLFGEGFRTMGALSTHGVSSDMGFINDIFLGGIVYSLAIYLYFIFIAVKIIRCDNESFSFCGWFFLCTLFIINIKAPIFTMNSFSNLFFVVAAAVNCFSLDKEKQNDK